MKQCIILLFAECISLFALSQEKVDERDLFELKTRMEGFFTTELQAKMDTNYKNIYLHIAQIWERSENGYWLYVEQAMASNAKLPYLQQVYHLYRLDDRTLISRAYELKEPLRFAGAYFNQDLLYGLTKDSLIDRKGCAVYLQKNTAGNFLGSTPGNECLHDMQNGTYTTSQVTVYEDKLLSWERGWNKNDKQIWGERRGGYQFIKQKE